VVEGLVAVHPHYRRTAIPRDTYPGQPAAVETFGVMATLVTSAAMPDAVVYRLTRTTFENLNAPRIQHPALARLDPLVMMREGFTAPLHPGAQRYYHEIDGP